jgi:hypothetical protein
MWYIFILILNFSQIFYCQYYKFKHMKIIVIDLKSFRVSYSSNSKQCSKIFNENIEIYLICFLIEKQYVYTVNCLFKMND